MSWGRRLVRIALWVLAGSVLGLIILIALVSSGDLENDSAADRIAESIYVALWIVVGLSVLALLVGGIAAGRGWSRFLLGVLLFLALAFFVSRLISPRSDALEIEEAIETVATTSDPTVCEELMTPNYLEQVSGVPAPFSDEVCEQTISFSEPADSVDVTDIEVDGEEASALVSYVGGAFDGSSLMVGLVDDDDWKLDRRLRFQSLDRPAFEKALREQLVEPEFAFSAKGADCIVRRLGALPDRALEQRLLSATSQTLDRAGVACDREGVEESITTALEEDPPYPPPVVACVERELEQLSDERLAQLYVDGPVEFGRLLLGCGRERVMEAYSSELEDAEYDSSAVECLLDAFEDLPAEEFTRLTHDDQRYGELYDDCE